ncbi:Lipopolysaccharide export LptBFGC system, permease protein LptF [Persephonella hydrogeniphila]|uniref:Lipopolysaccharide export LptBFGC system, permease protein LptF n=1 Tax=Persephonella hydrogeniphila TaxID=198703 RepID=A0A285NNR1_9AQUI|nr:LptF/LptG family permease [Persephonella hydrogeniphila]SNZ09496.1 Lipopolysaccharide export LptBFGC system, permease protein LptF [Persephonella hydrogeniphila]
MKILYRYLYRKLAIYLLVIVPSFSFVAILAELVELLRKAKNLDYAAIFLYSVYQLPEKIYYILPVSMVIAFFLLARDLISSKEIYPILLNGVSLRKLGISLFIFPAVVSGIQLFNLEMVMPEAKKNAQDIYMVLKKRSKEEPLIAYNSWVTIDKRTFIYFSFFDLLKKEGRGIAIIRYDKKFNPLMKIEGNFFKISDIVYIRNGKLVTIESPTNINLKKFKEYRYPQRIDVESLKKLIKVKKPVSIRQLYKSAVIAEKFGYPSNYYWSKMYSKLATVISPLILSFAFYPLIWSRKKSNIVIMAVLLVTYWYSTAFLSSIAQSNIIPYYGVFIVDVVYILLGLFLFMRLKFSEL